MLDDCNTLRINVLCIAKWSCKKIVHKRYCSWSVAHTVGGLTDVVLTGTRQRAIKKHRQAND